MPTQQYAGRTYGIDIPPVTQDEALELMLHHLSIAQAYFEATPETDETILELLRIAKERELHKEPIRLWFNAMTTVYEKMKELD